jgi:crotonobetainyl-CoA:carnitine CoA-transferase CaiB-like acyl-CoA transferase
VRDVKDAELGVFQVPGPLHRLTGEAPILAANPPGLGEHNAAILERHLRMSSKEVASLETSKVLASR